MISPLAFGLALIVASVLALRSRALAAQQTVAVLVGNYALGLLGQWATQSYDPWFWLLFLDGASALVVLQHPASRPQAVIGAIFFMQMFVHIAYGAASSNEHVKLYTSMIAIGGWGQLLILSLGGLHGRGRKVSGAGRVGGGDADNLAPHLARVEERP